jgi:hypothetical protein
VQNLSAVGAGWVPVVALVLMPEATHVGMGELRELRGLGGEMMQGKEDVSRLIEALCDGDLNSPARALWTVGLMKLLGEWAEEENHDPA